MMMFKYTLFGVISVCCNDGRTINRPITAGSILSLSLSLSLVYSVRLTIREEHVMSSIIISHRLVCAWSVPKGRVDVVAA